MTTLVALQTANKDQLKKVSKQLAKQLVVNVVLGVVVAVSVTLISGAILNVMQPAEKAE